MVSSRLEMRRFVLVFCRTELCAQKLSQMPLTMLFHDYAGGQNIIEALQEFERQFRRLVPENRQSLVHVVQVSDLAALDLSRFQLLLETLDVSEGVTVSSTNQGQEAGNYNEPCRVHTSTLAARH
eukprot:g78780.t1